MPLDPHDILRDIEKLRRLARRLAADPDLADDVIDDATTSGKSNIGNPFAYLRRVVVNAAYERRRGAEARRRRERKAARREPLPSAAEIAERAAVQRDVVDAVLALDESMRSVVLLHYFDNRSFESIAATLGCPAATVRSRHRRALEELKRNLDRRYRSERAAWALPLFAWANSSTAKVSTTMVASAVAVIFLCFVGVAIRDDLRPEASLPRDDRHATSTEIRRTTPMRSTDPTTSTTERMSSRPTPIIEPAIGNYVRGRVVDAKNHPVEGARVTVFPTIDGRIFDADSVADSGWRFTDTTDADGAFATPIDPESPTSSLIATAAGHGARLLTNVGIDREIVVRLDPAMILESRVLDISRKPIAGARVTWSILFGGAQLVTVGKTDNDGRVRVSGPIAETGELDVGRFAQSIIVEAEGFASCLEDSVPAPKNGIVARDFFLVRGAVIVATVIDAETRAPIPDAVCELWSAEIAWRYQGAFGKRFEPSSSLRTLARSVSGKNGEVEFSHIPAWGVEPAGRHDVKELDRDLGGIEAAPPGYARASVALSVPNDGAVVRIEIPCYPAVTIEGEVVDAAGAPVAGAQIGVSGRDCPMTRRESNDRSRDVVTDAAGRFRFSGVPIRRNRAVDVRVHALLDERAAGSVGLTLPTKGGAACVVAPKVVLSVVHEFVEISVVDRADKPILGAVASIGAVSAVTDKRGICRLTKPHADDSDGESVRILVQAHEFAAATVRVKPSNSSTAGPTIVRLEPGFCLSGRVVDSHGHPLPGVQLSAWNGALSDDAIDDPSRGDWLERDGVMALWGGCRSNGRGEFEIVGLPAGRCVLDARLAGDDGIARARLRDVQTNQSDSVVTLELPTPKLKEPSVDLLISLRDATDDTPIVRAHVELTNDDWSIRIGGTAVGPGEFRCAGVPRGSFKIAVRAVGYLPTPARSFETDGVAEAQPFVIRLDRGARVEGTLRMSDGSTLENPRGWSTSMSDGSGDDAMIDARSGRFVVDALEKGSRYRLVVIDTLPDGTWRVLTTALGEEIPGTADGRADWSAVLVPGGGVTLRTAESGGSIGRVSIASIDGTSAIELNRRGNNYGTFLPAGRYVVRRTTSTGVVERSFEIGIGPSQTVIVD